jgi:hypothetical protein
MNADGKREQKTGKNSSADEEDQEDEYRKDQMIKEVVIIILLSSSSADCSSSTLCPSALLVHLRQSASSADEFLPLPRHPRMSSSHFLDRPHGAAGAASGLPGFFVTALGRDLPKLFLKILPRRVRLSPLPIVIISRQPAAVPAEPLGSRRLVSGLSARATLGAPTRKQAIVPWRAGRGQRRPPRDHASSGAAGEGV